MAPNYTADNWESEQADENDNFPLKDIQTA